MSTEIREVEPNGTRYYDSDGRPVVDIATCGHCGQSWDDAISTSITPAPSGRCPFEYEHEYEDDSEDLGGFVDELADMEREAATEQQPALNPDVLDTIRLALMAQVDAYGEHMAAGERYGNPGLARYFAGELWQIDRARRALGLES